jgi:hypothetical protein
MINVAVTGQVSATDGSNCQIGKSRAAAALKIFDK